MTKTLTEQWREGTLNGGYYYLKMKDGNIFIDHTEYIFWAHEIRWETKDSSYVKEVLAPVPSYDEIKRLQEQLKEAREVVKFYAETTVGHKQKDGTYGMWVCSGEMAWGNPLDRIKSRMDYICYDPRPAKKWLKKWGVK